MHFYKDVNSVTPTTRPDVLDVDAVAQSVRTLVSTRKGERFFEPEYGINIADFLFELMDDAASLQLLTEIIDAVRVYEPRVQIDTQRSNVIPDPDNHCFDVTVFFDIVGLDNEGQFSVTTNIRQ